MKGHAIIDFNHRVLGLAENPALGPAFFRQNTSGYALGVLTPKASPSGWGFSQAQHPMIKTYIPAWITNCIHFEVWDQIFYTFPNFNGATIEVGNGSLISSHTLLGMWLIIYPWINTCW